MTVSSRLPYFNPEDLTSINMKRRFRKKLRIQDVDNTVHKTTQKSASDMNPRINGYYIQDLHLWYLTLTNSALFPLENMNMAENICHP